MSCKKTILIGFLLMIFITGHAATKDKFSLSLYTGPNNFIESDLWYWKDAHHSEVLLGCGCEYKISKLFSLNLTFDYTQFVIVSLVDRDEIPIYNFSHRWETKNIILHLKVTPFKSKISPYFSIGLGYNFTDYYIYDTRAKGKNSTSDSLVCSGGAGVQTNITGKLDCFLELNVYWQRDTKGSYVVMPCFYMPIKLGIAYHL